MFGLTLAHFGASLPDRHCAPRESFLLQTVSHRQQLRLEYRPVIPFLTEFRFVSISLPPFCVSEVSFSVMSPLLERFL